MMRVAVVSGSGRTAQEIGAYCHDALRGLGHDARQWVHVPDRGAGILPTFALRYFRRFHDRRLDAVLLRFQPEVVLVIKGQDLDPSHLGTLRREMKSIWVNWWIDDPGLLAASRRLSPAYDLFLTNDPTAIEEHRRAGARNVDWLTFGCDPRVHRPLRLSPRLRRRYGCDVIFAGSLTPRRVEMLAPLVPLGLALWADPEIRWLQEDGGIGFLALPKNNPLQGARRGNFIWGENLAAAYSASRICVNVHSHGAYDVNMRVFEAAACGTLVVTEDRPMVRELFTVDGPEAEVAVYSNARELTEKVEYFLAHEDERRAVAIRGMERARRDHTYECRMKRVLSLLSGVSA
ncbi:MAG: glycosyltransferase [Elusimicrobia bacterium]|nr:glycosyltransferase [Elusimicrobiota bacterium]